MINTIPKIKHKDSGNFFLIAGPCVVEDELMPLAIATEIANICDRLQIPFIFKASYKKANRTRLDSFTGIGDKKALQAISAVGKTLGIPTITDIHTEAEAELAAKYVDILQIPAFLARQTDLLVAAANTGKYINVKKGQFMSPDSMKFVVEKIKSAGNKQVMITERGSMFGYGDLVVDFRGFYEMKKFGVPLILDATHSLQQPNSSEGVTGGRPELIETISKAGIAAGADGIFIETHPDPGSALSDGANMLPLNLLEELLDKLKKLHIVSRDFDCSC